MLMYHHYSLDLLFIPFNIFFLDEEFIGLVEVELGLGLILESEP